MTLRSIPRYKELPRSPLKCKLEPIRRSKLPLTAAQTDPMPSTTTPSTTTPSTPSTPSTDIDLVANGKGEEWVLSDDTNSFRKWYSGIWQANRLHGTGTIYDEKNARVVFRGTFKHGKREGFGKQFSSGSSNNHHPPHHHHKGHATNTTPHSQPPLQLPSIVSPPHVMYRGGFVNDKPEGLNCAVFDGNGRVVYEGGMKRGLYHGKGVLFHAIPSTHPNVHTAPRIVQYVGQFQKNMKWGHGKEYNNQGELIYQGAWKMNARHGYGRAYHPSTSATMAKKSRLAFVGRFEARLNHVCQGRGVPHGGSGCLYFQDGRRFISSSFHDGCTDPLVISTMFYPDDGRVVIGYFHKIHLDGLVTGQTTTTIWRGTGTILWRNGDVYQGDFRDGVPHGRGGKSGRGGGRLGRLAMNDNKGMFTTRGLDQFCGQFVTGHCIPSISAREVVRHGFCILFSFDQYPSHVSDPAGVQYEMDHIHQLMVHYQFEIWRVDNARLQTVEQTFLDAQRYLNNHPNVHDCVLVFAAGMSLRPDTPCTVDLKEFPNPDEFLNDEFVVSLKGVPKMYVNCCSHAPRDTYGWNSSKRYEEVTTTNNIVVVNATRNSTMIWDKQDQGCQMIQCLCAGIRDMCEASFNNRKVWIEQKHGVVAGGKRKKRKNILGMDLSLLLDHVYKRGEALLPFETIYVSVVATLLCVVLSLSFCRN